MSDPCVIQCQACKELFGNSDFQYGFERWGHGGTVRLLNNPAVWGATQPKYTLLGFSKGETQNKAMAEAKAGRLAFEDVPFKGMRKRLGWLLKALQIRPDERIDDVFRPTEREFRVASLIRCSISAKNGKGEYSYKLADILAADGSSGGKVREIIRRCTKAHITPGAAGQTFIMLGLDTELISWCRDSFAAVFGTVRSVTQTTYRTKDISWVHVAHPSGNQTDPQYLKWCEGGTSVPKVHWAREEIAYRKRIGGGQQIG